jgi:DNA polymerase I
MKKVYIDIETDDVGSWREFENRVLGISCFYNEKIHSFLLSPAGYCPNFGVYPAVDGKALKWQVWSYTDEKVLLEAFMNFLIDEDFDMIAGWNIMGFDFPYLVGRMEKLGIDVRSLSPAHILTIWELNKKEKMWFMAWGIKLVGRIVFDVMWYYKLFHVTGTRSLALDAVAREELGIGKLCYDRPAKLWKENLDKFISYNVRDVDLVRKIDEKCQITSFALDFSRFTGAELDDLFWKSQIVDTFMLYEKGNYVLPTKKSEKREKYPGAVVKEPLKGLFKNVANFDVSRMYPSILLGGNMSPETLTEESGEDVISFENGVKFRKYPLGFVPRILLKLFEYRKKIEKQMEGLEVGSEEYERLVRLKQVVKDTTNSVYGVLAYPKFRLYSPQIAQTVTLVGRKLLTGMFDVLEKKGYTVIYGDTDSLFVQQESPQKALELEVELNDELKKLAKGLGMNPEYFSIKLDKFYSGFFMSGKKKRYAGKVIWKGKPLESPVLDIRGFEYRRSDMPREFAKKQGELLNMILDGRKMEADLLITGVVDNVLNRKYLIYDILRPITLGKEVYAVNTPQARAVAWSNMHLGTDFGVGSKIYLLPVECPDTDVIAINEEIPLPEVKVNYRKIVVEFLKKAKQLYEAIGWEMPEVDVENMGQTKLTRWLNNGA